VASEKREATVRDESVSQGDLRERERDDDEGACGGGGGRGRRSGCRDAPAAQADRSKRAVGAIEEQRQHAGRPERPLAKPSNQVLDGALDQE
jgi:hypothetical protein